MKNTNQLRNKKQLILTNEDPRKNPDTPQDIPSSKPKNPRL